MLFQVNYRTLVGGSAKDNEASAKRGLALFAKWAPPAGMEVKGFYARADGKGGTVMVETDDVKTLLDGPAKFGTVNDFEIVPVLDITEATPIASDAIAWRESIS